MIKKVPFANAFAFTSTIGYFLYYFLATIFPRLFKVIYNSQYLGADITSLLPIKVKPLEVVTTLAITAMSSWVFGYLVAYFYNAFSKKR